MGNHASPQNPGNSRNVCVEVMSRLAGMLLHHRADLLVLTYANPAEEQGASWIVVASAGTMSQLLQFRVLRLGLLQDGDVGVGVLPESEKSLVRGLRFGVVPHQAIGPS